MEDDKEMLKNIEHAIKNFDGRLVDCVAIGNIYKKYLQQNEIIDLMAEQLVGIGLFDEEKEEVVFLMGDEEVKEYYRKKVENESKNNNT